MSKRDNFREATRRVLGERVAYRCAYVGCGKVTIGPHTRDDRSTVVGQAAHITAAAKGGPRFDPTLTSEERRAPSNGIWMCNIHGRQVDVDEDRFSAETLREWKLAAELRAQAAIGERPPVDEPTTLVALGVDHVVRAFWTGADDSVWRFQVVRFIRGNVASLKGIFASSPPEFVVIGSQGDGRRLSATPSWESRSGALHLVLPVAARVLPLPPGRGTDLRIENGDLVVGPDGLAMVSGTDADIQSLELGLGLVYGTWWGEPFWGSLVSSYYHEFKDDRALLAELIQLEIARLATVDLGESPPNAEIWMVNSVDVPTTELRDGFLDALVELTWSDQTRWRGTLHIGIADQDELEQLPRLQKSGQELAEELASQMADGLARGLLKR